MERVPKKPVFRLDAGNNSNRKNIKSKSRIVQTVTVHISLGSADNAPLFAHADGVLRKVRRTAGFYLQENEYLVIPGDDIDFTEFHTVGRSDYPKPERAEIADPKNFRMAAEREKTMKEERERHKQNPGE